jgi:hypothetical protein
MPASSFVFPSSYELDKVDRVMLPALTMDDPIFNHFPIRSRDSHVLQWEQQDNFTGLQAVRGLNGQPARVRRKGGKRYTMEPGVYGEFTQVDEQEITTRRNWGDQTARPINVTDLVRECQDQLRGRHINRVRKTLWDLAVYAVFTVLDEQGTVVHQDAYAQRLFTSSVTWDTPATATPLGDFRAIQLLGRGYSTSFGMGATAYMNQQTANWLLANTNTADLYGRRTQGLATINNLALVNELFAGDGLPKLSIHDDHYIDDAGSVQLFIPDGYVVVFGRRANGAELGQFSITRNANATPIGAPTTYTVVTESERPPKTITVDYGFNGGPELKYPGSILVMKVK